MAEWGRIVQRGGQRGVRPVPLQALLVTMSVTATQLGVMMVMHVNVVTHKVMVTVLVGMLEA